MGDAFERALRFTFGAEGGVHIEEGKLVCRGIDREEHPAWRGWSFVDTLRREGRSFAEIATDPRLQVLVREFYLEEFWKPIRGDELPALVAMVVFDCAVNTGKSESIRNLQRMAWQLEDGKIGPKTIRAVREAGNQILPGYLEERCHDYIALAARRPDKRWAAGGWLRRVGDLVEEAFEDLHLWGA